MSTLGGLSDNGRGYGGYAPWQHIPGLAYGPSDPQADSMEAVQERREREDAYEQARAESAAVEARIAARVSAAFPDGPLSWS